MALQPTSSSHKQSSINPLPLPLPSSQFSSQPNMLDPGSKFPISHVDFSDQTGRRLSAADGYDSYNNLHHVHHGVLNYDSRVQKTAQNYANYRGFGAQASMVEDEDDESGDSTPPLWRSSPSRSPPSPHRQYRCLSPSSKAQAIARGQKELMEMVSRMPESCYELSLKDLVEHQPVNVVESRQESFAHGTNEDSINKVKKKKKKQNNQKNPQINRSGSMDNGGFLLKMVFPISLGSKKPKKKKKNESKSNTNQSVKVSPKPTLADSSGNNKTTVDKEWWKKRSESSESESGGSTMNSGSTRSSRSSSTSSSSSCRSITNTSTRTRNGKNGCLDFILSRRSKASR